MKKFWHDKSYFTSQVSKEQSLVGTLNPISWSSLGKVQQFSIYSDGEDIIIEGYQNKRKLEKLLSKNVLAKGKLRIDEDGEKFLILKSIKELSGPTSPAINLRSPVEASFWSEEYSLSIPKEYALAQYGQVSNSYLEAC